MSATSSELGRPDWEVQTIQLNLFTIDPATKQEQAWIEDLTGETPERTRKKNFQEDLLGRNDRVFKVTVQPPKITWMEFPLVLAEADEPPDRIPSVGVYPAVRNRFIELMVRWLPSCPPIWRVGFGVSLVRPATGHAHAYRLLADCLPALDVDPEGSSDLTYQINRRRKSVVYPDMKLNRLSRWSAMKLEFESSFQVPGEGDKPIERVALYGCRTELDTNTDPAHVGPLDAAVLPALLGELVSLADELSEQGDVP